MPVTMGNPNYWKLWTKLLEPEVADFGSPSQIGDSCFTVVVIFTVSEY
jgi:hypothetical protein